jgi:hypothetical protein
MKLHNQNNPLFTLTVYEFSELQRSILMEALNRESSKEIPKNSAEYLNPPFQNLEGKERFPVTEFRKIGSCFRKRT